MQRLGKIFSNLELGTYLIFLIQERLIHLKELIWLSSYEEDPVRNEEQFMA